ncbi:MAG TPA: transcription elongation factor [Actinoplanes sp.]|nr:transcription elongation factor [Actinoplanes sp.]
MGVVRAVSRNGEYSFSKPNRDEIVLEPGLGVHGDVHAGVTVRHRSRVRADPGQPNLRQVHLIQSELFGEVGASGYRVAAGQLGENVTTSGVDLLALPRGTVLRFGPVGGGGTTKEGAIAAGRVLDAARRARLDPATADAVAALAAAVAREDGVDDPRPALVITGLRNPCHQIDNFSGGLLKEVAYRDAGGAFVLRAGVMGVVLRGGPVRPDDPITVELPPLSHEPLDRV